MFEEKKGIIFSQARRSLKYFRALMHILSNFSSELVVVQTCQISYEKD
jgi:hypothetical protein